MPFPKFDRSQMQIKDVRTRASKVKLADLISPEQWMRDNADIVPGPEYQGLAEQILQARFHHRPVILFLAGHVVKHGLSLFVNRLMAAGLVTHVAANGSVAIHDWELGCIGETSEDVGRYITRGEFGNWDVPGKINNVINQCFTGEETIGEMLGNWLMYQEDAVQSILRNAYLYNIPCTFHVLVGGDIIHQHPNCTSSLFAASYQDFLVFTHAVSQLTGGVYLNIGSQVTGTEVFLKALSMARNVAQAKQEDPIHNITTAMADFVQLPPDWRSGEANESDPAYYYRPWKTLLLRTVADGGRSFYLQGPHTTTLPLLYKSLFNQRET